MANLKDLIVNGASRFIGKTYINDSQITTINNSTVGDNPKFTDTVALGSMTGTLGLDHGGTGATSAAAARTNLGLGSAALASTAASVGNNTNLPTGAAVQTYVSNLVAGVLHYKGTKSTVADLPTSGNTTGDVWHVTQNGSEWAWDGSTWQELGTSIDLSNYVTNVTASTVSVGSASAGTAIPADDITAWTTNTPTAVTPATVVTSASGASASVSNGVLTITNGSFSTGSAATVTPGTAASLSYTSKSIPNISVTSKNVVSGITVSK